MLEEFFRLFDAPTKADAEKICRVMQVSDEGLYMLIEAASSGQLSPYQYACHFSAHVPEHLSFGKREHGALGGTGPGPFDQEATRAATRISQTFRERRQFAAHLFYVPDHGIWHLIYFDQRDRTPYDNHWKVGGPHVHYSRESICNEPLEIVWEAIHRKLPRAPKAFHIRYEPEEEG